MSASLRLCLFLFVYVCLRLCLYFCLTVSVYVCMSLFVYVCLRLCLLACQSPSMDVCFRLCLSAYLSPSMGVCLFVCVVCFSSSMFVSVYVCLSLFVYVCLSRRHELLSGRSVQEHLSFLELCVHSQRCRFLQSVASVFTPYSVCPS